jgi:hypothetical protein
MDAIKKLEELKKVAIAGQETADIAGEEAVRRLKQ